MSAPERGPEEPGYEAQRYEAQRYEAPPSVGKLMVWLLVFMVAALAVVLGGVYLT